MEVGGGGGGVKCLSPQNTAGVSVSLNMVTSRNYLGVNIRSMDMMFNLLTCVYLLQSLSPALIDIRKMCYQISDTSLCHMEKKHTYTLQEFQDTQLKQLQKVQCYIHTAVGSKICHI